MEGTSWAALAGIIGSVVTPLVALLGWAVRTTLKHSCDQLDKERGARASEHERLCNELTAEREAKEKSVTRICDAITESRGQTTAEHTQLAKAFESVCARVNGRK